MTQHLIPFVTDSPTSQQAASAIKPDAGRLRLKVYDAIMRHGAYGLTDEEGVDATGIAPSTYRPRRIELVEQGKVIDSGQTRLTRAGRKAVVWIAKE